MITEQVLGHWTAASEGPESHSGESEGWGGAGVGSGGGKLVALEASL